MRRTAFAALAMLGLGALQPAQAQSNYTDLVKLAIAAEGGEPALRALKTMSVTGEVTHWEPEQSIVAGGAPRMLGTSTFKMTWDLAGGSARIEWSRKMLYPTVRQFTLTEVLTPKYGFAIDESGPHAMSGVRLAAELRELDRLSPTLLLKALDNPDAVTNEGALGLGQGRQPAIGLKVGNAKFLVMFDRKTHLPIAIRTVDDDSVRGDSNFDLLPDNWTAFGNVTMPRGMTYLLNEVQIARQVFKDVTPNAAIPADAFTPPDSIKAALKPPATGAVPYQWVLRQFYIGGLVDSDTLYAPQGASLKLVELAPDVQQVVGGAQSSLVVAMKDGLVVIDAPINEGQSRWTIDAAKAKYPGKPIKYLVLTHHHRERAAGVRTYMAEGAKVIVPSPDFKYVMKIGMAEHVAVPDELARRRVSPVVEEVKDQMTLKDDAEEIRLYRVPNPHVEGMLIAHVVKPNIVWVTDLLTPAPGAPRTIASIAVGDATRKYGISGARFAGGQGTVATQSEMQDALTP